MTHNPNVYGYVNGKPVFSRDEFIFEHRNRIRRYVFDALAAEGGGGP